MKKPDNEALRGVLEEAVKTILTDPKATTAERLQAIDQGTKLLGTNLKFKGSGEDSSFFRKS